MIRDFLKNFVTRCGIALETEDKLLLGASRLRDEDGGLLRCNNERYYQFILWRAAFLEWSAQAEFSNHDLVILDPRKNPVVLFEMKRWMSPSGIPELPEMLTDLKKLTNTRIPNGVFIVFSSNNRGEMDTQLEFLETHLFPGEVKPYRATYCFPTVSPYSPSAEFWMAGWVIKGT